MRKRRSGRRWLRWGLGLALVAVLGPLGAWAALHLAAALGDADPRLLAAAPESWRLLARDGTLLRALAAPDGAHRLRAPLSGAAGHLREAVLATEDQRFFAHDGVDGRALLRAAFGRLRGEGGGGSTLTQQLAKLLLRRPRTFAAKWSEAVLALRLERVFSKERLLEEWLARAPFGPRLVGAQAASLAYFGKPASGLARVEAALLAGLAGCPVGCNPRRFPRRALVRRAHVLRRLVATGALSEAERVRLEREPLRLVPEPEAESEPEPEAVRLAPHFARRVQRLAQGEVWTTLDAGLQRHAEALVQAQRPWLADHGARDAAALVVENVSGDVLAYVGAAPQPAGTLPEVDGVGALRQPGSALKPFAYAAAFARGLRPETLVDDEPVQVETPLGVWEPANVTRIFRGRVTLREALARSYNLPAVRVAAWLGVPALLGVLREVGLASLDRPAEHYGLSLVLGGGEVTLWELAQAYLVLAREGDRVALRTHADERLPAAERVLEAAAVRSVTAILSGALARGHEGAAPWPRLSFDAALKTGTSSGPRDTWAVGYTPEVTVAVWVGNFDGAPLRDTPLSFAPLPLWHALTAAAMDGRARRHFGGGSSESPVRAGAARR